MEVIQRWEKRSKRQRGGFAAWFDLHCWIRIQDLRPLRVVTGAGHVIVRTTRVRDLPGTICPRFDDYWHSAGDNLWRTGGSHEVDVREDIYPGPRYTTNRPTSTITGISRAQPKTTHGHQEIILGLGGHVPLPLWISSWIVISDYIGCVWWWWWWWWW